MVAMCSSRRQMTAKAPIFRSAIDWASAAASRASRPAADGAASRRCRHGIEISRDGRGEIAQIRIGRWRVVRAAAQRRLAEVRQLPEGRAAVRIERFAENGPRASSEIWQLYDAEGRLEAALQSGPDGTFALWSDFVARQACRLVRNDRGELEIAERWRI